MDYPSPEGTSAFLVFAIQAPWLDALQLGHQLMTLRAITSRRVQRRFCSDRAAMNIHGLLLINCKGYANY